MRVGKENRVPVLQKYMKFIQCNEKWLMQRFVLGEFNEIRTETRNGSAALVLCLNH